MDSQFGQYDQKVAKYQSSNYQNPKQLMNSNIQYQFLKYNGFKPMNVEPQCNEDKVEDYILRPQPPQAQVIADNYLGGACEKYGWGNEFIFPSNNWQLGLQRYNDIFDTYPQPQIADFEQTQQSLNKQIQISDDSTYTYQKPQNIAQKIRFIEQQIQQIDNDGTLMLDKQKESILQSGIKNILKNGSKKIMKSQFKHQEKPIKLKNKAVSFNKSKRVDQNKRVMSKQPSMEYDKNEQDELIYGSPVDLEIFNEKPSVISQYSKHGDELNRSTRNVSHLQTPDSSDNQIEKTVNNDHNDTVSQMSGPAEQSKNQVLVLSDDSLKMNIPYLNNSNGEMIEDEEEEDQIHMQQKRKKCRTQKTKYYQNFDFFFKRSCFRTMTEFYKDKFNSFHKKRLTKMKIEQPVAWNKYMKNGGIKSLSKDQMYQIVQGFIDHIFGKDILSNNTSLDANQKKLIILRVMMILFSHRHTKKDTFIEQAQQEALQSGCKELAIDFSTIRDVMYKYSKKAEEKYFQCETESFMFAAFALSDEGVNFLKEKPDNCKDHEKLNRILRDLNCLKEQALLSLGMMSQGKVLKSSTDGSSEAQGAELNSDLKNDEQSVLQPQCDLQVGGFLFKELKRMTKNML